MDNFKVMCSEKEIQKRIRELAEEVDEDYKAKGKQRSPSISGTDPMIEETSIRGSVPVIDSIHHFVKKNG